MESVKLFKVLSDETRLRILVLLKEKPLCVCQMQEILKLPQSKVSKHLAKLRDQNFVKSFQDGKFVKYELVPDEKLLAVLNIVLADQESNQQCLIDLNIINDFDDLVRGE